MRPLSLKEPSFVWFRSCRKLRKRSEWVDWWLQFAMFEDLFLTVFCEFFYSVLGCQYDVRLLYLHLPQSQHFDMHRTFAIRF
jgi:hypothetical protein